MARKDPRDGDLETGRYYRAGRTLFRIEAQLGQHVVAEDCHDGHLFDVPLDIVRAWTPVEPRWQPSA